MGLEKQKKVKVKEGSQDEEDGGIVSEEDRFSRLPDPLLHNILSFLPTKFAACTSVLSKRWRTVWIFTPVLNFHRWYRNSSSSHGTHGYDEVHLKQTAEVMNSVDRMLSFNDDMPNVKRLYLDSDDHFDESSVNALISTLIKKRKVEELVLDLNDVNFTFTPCLFTCESLTLLDLELQDVLNLPESISFPRLKILRLTYMTFIDENLTQKLFSNCPVLEELTLDCIYWENMNVFSISAPTLKCLSLEGIRYGLEETCGISIYAPSLLSLVYTGYASKEIQLHSFPLLVDAGIDFDGLEHSRGTEEEKGYAASKFIGKLLNVERLKMSGESFKALSFADDLLSTLPTFCNLIHLEVTSEFPCLTKTLMDFLRISPNLESLIFAGGFEQVLSNDDDSWTTDLVRQCPLVHLKSVKFLGFYGQPGELNAVKLFLKNAGILETMTVVSSLTLSTYKKNMVRELMQTYSRGSTRCVIKFS